MAVAAIVVAGCLGAPPAGDPCAGVACSAHGSCFVEGEAPQCACERGFHPVFLACEDNDPTDPCLDVACSGHGTCRPIGGYPVCECDPGFAPPPESELLCFRTDEAGARDDGGPDVGEDGDRTDGPPDERQADDAPLDEPGAEDAPVDEPGAEDATPDELEAEDTPVDEPGAEDATLDESGVEDATLDELGAEDAPPDEREAEDAPVEEPGAEDAIVDEPGADEADAEADAGSSCGDGTVDPGEECDDGNAVSGDGCEGTCVYSCHAASECLDGDPCTGDSCAAGGTGQVCVHPPAPGRPCNDGDPCTSPDTCDASGTCVGAGGSPPGTPRPLAPGNGAATGSFRAPASFNTLRPLFRWAAPPDDGCGPPLYEFQASHECTTPGFASCPFAAPAVSGSDLPETSLRCPVALEVSASPPAGRRYYWRVRACRGALCSDWSPVRYVDVGRAPGDLNGDGWSDVVIAAPRAAYASTDAGRLYVHLGSAVLDATPDFVIDGEGNEQLGTSVAGVGDVNADGFADLLAGAPYNDDVALNAGRALLFLGGASLDTTADVVFAGTESLERLGVGAAGAGDVDGDGLADLVLGAPWSDPYGSATAGRVRVFLGGSPPDTTADAVLSGEAAYGAFGTAVAGPGDVDGDGLADLVVGAPQVDLDATDAGRAYVYFGRASIGPAPDLTLLGPEAGVELGRSASGADLNDDGFAGIVVGTGDSDVGGRDAGQVYVYAGGPVPDAGADVVATGGWGGDRLGQSVAAGGDVNGDGFADLVAGAPGFDTPVSYAGAVQVFLGGPAFDEAIDLTLLGDSYGYLGWAVGMPGDVNGDGFGDVLGGAPRSYVLPSTANGRAYLWLGGSPMDATRDVVFAGTPEDVNLGEAVAGARH